MEMIPVSKLKAEALALVERASRGEEFVITKRGKPVVRMIPIDEPPGLLGSVRFVGSPDDLMEPTGETWSAEIGR